VLEIAAPSGRADAEADPARTIDARKRRQMQTGDVLDVVGEVVGTSLLSTLPSGRRSERGLSQERLGQTSRHHRNYVGGLERGELNPSLASILKLADAFGIEASELLVLSERLGRSTTTVVRSAGLLPSGDYQACGSATLLAAEYSPREFGG